MARYYFLTLISLIVFSDSFADTFTRRTTGETFNGYVVKKTRGDRTQVRIEARTARYLNLNEYKIERNHLGRKSIVSIFSIKEPVELIVETEAFEQAIVLAANQGPLFILIEIDTAGGKSELAQRVAAAITEIDNCDVVALVGNGKFNGAFSAGAVVALSCHKVYMLQNSAIGAPTEYVQAYFIADTTDRQSADIDADADAKWRIYASKIAELRTRPALLVKAMFDRRIEILEVNTKDGRGLLLEPKDRQPEHSLVRTLTEVGSLLTLNADDAARFGLIDKVVVSRAELIVALGAATAKSVSDTRVIKARRAFDKIRSRIDRNLTAVNELQTIVDDIEAELKIVDEEIRRLTGAAYRPGEGFVGSALHRYWQVEGYIRQVLQRREALLIDLANVLADQMGNYDAAIFQTRRWPDLADLEQSLTTDFESAAAKFRDTRSQLMFR